MRRAITRICGAVLAVLIVAVAAWTFLVPFPERFNLKTMLTCMCIPTRWHPANSEALLEANGWVRFDAGPFNLYVPPGAVVRPRNTRSGQIITTGFTFEYELGSAGFASEGSEIVDEKVRIDGMPATLRRATLAGSPSPYFAGLYVPRAVVRDGQPVALLVYTVARTRHERAVADAILATVSFKPFFPPAGWVKPAPVKAEPPVFDIAPDPS